VTRRKRPSLETKLAAMTVLYFDIPYLHAKKMTQRQVNSLVHWDHNILHETEHPDRNVFWNYTPRMIREHRRKTKQDLKIVAKGRRIRRQGHSLILSPEARQELRQGNPIDVLREVYSEGKYEGRQETNETWVQEANRPGGAVQWALIDMAEALGRGFEEGAKSAYERAQHPPNQYAENYAAIDWSTTAGRENHAQAAPRKRKIHSRGFDKRFKRKMSGKVVPK
jgi:hypothetical protein